MKTGRWVGATTFVLLLLAGCVSPAQPVSPAVESGQADAAGSSQMTTIDSLLLEAIDADRTVQPGAEEIFEFKVVNATDQPLPVMIVLEHADGQRWRTSLCADKQCLLGDGSQPTKTDPIILPPYLEQVFQAHLFVAPAAQPGQQTALTLRVESPEADPLADNVALRARVVER